MKTRAQSVTLTLVFIVAVAAFNVVGLWLAWSNPAFYAAGMLVGCVNGSAGFVILTAYVITSHRRAQAEQRQNNWRVYETLSVCVLICMMAWPAMGRPPVAYAQSYTDLSVNVSNRGTAVTPGTTANVAVAVSSSGPDLVNGVVVDVVIGPALTGLTWTCTGAGGAVCVSGNGSSFLVNLPAGGSVEIQISGRVDPSAVGSFLSTASLSLPGGTLDPDTSNNSMTDTDPLIPRADLFAKLIASNQFVALGQRISLSFQVGNDGPSTAASTAQFAPPFQLGNLTWTCAGSDCPAASGTGNVASPTSLLPGEAMTFTLSMDVLSGVLGEIIAPQASLPAPGSDPDSANNTSIPQLVVVESADIQVSKTAHAPVVSPGAAVTYTIRVTNTGPHVAPSVRITDTLPPQIIGATWTCSTTGGASCSPVSGAGDVDINANMPANSVATVTLVGTISAAATGTLANSAGGNSTGILPIDPNPVSNVTTTVISLNPVADLSISQTYAPNPPVLGGLLTFSIVVTNAGPSQATNATMTNTIPSGTSFVSVTSNRGTCTYSTRVDCSFGNMAVGQTALVTLVVRINSVGVLVNSATAQAIEADPVTSNNTTIVVVVTPVTSTPTNTLTATPSRTPTVASGTGTVFPNTPAPTGTPPPPTGGGGLSPLEISKSAHAPSVLPGDMLTFTVSVRNPNGVALTQVTVADSLPQLLIHVTHGATKGVVTFDATNNRIFWEVGTLGAGETATLVIVTRVSLSATPGEIYNRAVGRTEGTVETGSNTTITRTYPTQLPVTGGNIALWLVALAIALLMGAVVAIKGLRGLVIAVLAVALVGCNSQPDTLSPDLVADASPSPTSGAATPNLPEATSTPMPITTLEDLFSDMALKPVTRPLPAGALSRVGNQTYPTPTPWWSNTAPAGDNRVKIARLGTEYNVVPVLLQGNAWNVEPLRQEVGWLQSTGNDPYDMDRPLALAAHSTLNPDGAAGPFKRLGELRRGDEIVLTWGGQTFTYNVLRSYIVQPQDVNVLYSKQPQTLILTTCTDWNPETQSYIFRLIVEATLERVQ